MTIGVIVSHAQWDPRRHDPLTRLLRSLRDTIPAVLVSIAREHASDWAVRAWREAAESSSTHSVMLNDDVAAHPDMMRHVSELVELMPDSVISLHPNFSAHLSAAQLGHRITRCYWPSGPAYVMPRAVAMAILDWLDTIDPRWFAGQVNEDGAIASFLWARQTPSYCSIPALVRHDASVPSTLGYDGHADRTSHVDWDQFSPGGWIADDVERAPYVQTPWMSPDEYRTLGDALRGVVPLCGMCLYRAAKLVNKDRETGVCEFCARGIAEIVGR